MCITHAKQIFPPLNYFLNVEVSVLTMRCSVCAFNAITTKLLFDTSFFTFEFKFKVYLWLKSLIKQIIFIDGTHSLCWKSWLRCDTLTPSRCNLLYFMASYHIELTESVCNIDTCCFCFFENIYICNTFGITWHITPKRLLNIINIFLKIIKNKHMKNERWPHPP